MIRCLIVFILCLQLVGGDQKIAPQLRPIALDKEIPLGENVHLLCMFSKGSLPVKFNWFHRNAMILESERLQLENSSPYSSVLILNSVQPNDQGEYTCEAQNEIGSDRTWVELRVLTPPFWSEEPRNVSRSFGGPISIRCSATGHPTPEIKWYRFNGMELVLD